MRHVRSRHLPAWEISNRRHTRGERVLRTLQACASSNRHERAHVARALRHAPHWLLSEPSIEGALKSLREDPVPLVRTDVAWSEHCKVRRTVKQELAYSLLHSLLRQARVMRQKALRLMGRRQRSA